MQKKLSQVVHIYFLSGQLFLPNKWPTFLKKPKVVSIWDLNGKKYIDLSFMGVGTNTWLFKL